MTWAQGQAVIEQLLSSGNLERVTPNLTAAEASLSICEAHITAARTIRRDDPVGAVSLAYDAARKALVALMLAQGLRPTRRGGHVAVTEAASAQLDPPLRVGRRVDRIRRLRNANEYPDAATRLASVGDADDAIEVAVEALDAARRMLPHLTPF
ncbi:HEPN domain-containing protein [Microcella putealis]|uniref:HEPN domain-containing protein n=1 Tax=Microcella putealis TaxID=337005 RepID=A0A4Q7LTR3_9MICO|nr:HEPN domain-containing protein [Microcella putealis]RZS57723.1 HEPN domain-containing protein [Microcella putealis]TQM24790.1 HEPN domain-containing protein [Microcella putealis]